MIEMFTQYIFTFCTNIVLLYQFLDVSEYKQSKAKKIPIFLHHMSSKISLTLSHLLIPLKLVYFRTSMMSHHLLLKGSEPSQEFLKRFMV